jgi:hypothetical protein
MTRFLHHAAFAAGLAAVAWVGAGYIGSNPLALAITLLVGAFYLAGTLELHRFHQATLGLARALAGLSEAPANLGAWLGQLDPSLQNPVRLRIEGERVGLPAPALTPYLAGLLVLLGMLGTFLGMVVTLNGTGLALDSATDLAAVRASLSAPVKGLGLAFGTSIAGVAASAMLGLMSALCRRERLRAAQALDTGIATTLRAFSLTHQREESFKLLQQQARVLPELVGGLQAMMGAMERQGQALNERLLAGQDGFHRTAEAAYAALAASVDRSLKDSLTDSARAAGATIQPVVEATMAAIARETAALHGSVSQAVQQQLDALSARVQEAAATAADGWRGAQAEQQRANAAQAAELRAALDHFAASFEQRSASLLGTLEQAQAQQRGALAAQDEQRLAAFSEALQSMTASLQQHWQQAGADALAQQQQICQTLAQTAREMSTEAQAHAQATVAEIGRLVQAASEAPRVAAEVVAELRQKLSQSMAQDNAMLEERSRLLDTVAALLDTVNHASVEQKAAIDALVGASADVLQRVGARFTEEVGAHTEKMALAAAQVTGGAVEVASLGEAFGFAVERFGESNDKLVAHLQRIEAALGQSMARSDEQLAYYVAQAREVIDLSILSQKQIVDDLQQLAGSRALAASEA